MTDHDDNRQGEKKMCLYKQRAAKLAAAAAIVTTSAMVTQVLAPVVGRVILTSLLVAGSEGARYGAVAARHVGNGAFVLGGKAYQLGADAAELGVSVADGVALNAKTGINQLKQAWYAKDIQIGQLTNQVTVLEQQVVNCQCATVEGSENRAQCDSIARQKLREQLRGKLM